MKNAGILIGLAVLIGAAFFARKALASVGAPGGKDVTRDAKLGATPIHRDGAVAAPAKPRGSFAPRRLGLPSSAFQNPAAKTGTRYPYGETTNAANRSPLRVDYAFNTRSTVKPSLQ